MLAVLRAAAALAGTAATGAGVGGGTHPGSDVEPGLALGVDVEVELFGVADLAEQPGLERDQLDRGRQRQRAHVALDVGQPHHGLAVGVDQLVEDDPRLTANLRRELVGPIVDPAHRVFVRLARRLLGRLVLLGIIGLGHGGQYTPW